MDTTSLYELEGVGRRYGQGATEVRALEGVDLRIASGEFVVVAGPSGSGKTTLLQLLGALDRPTDGVVRFEGRDLRGLGDSELARLRLGELGVRVPAVQPHSHADRPPERRGGTRPDCGGQLGAPPARRRAAGGRGPGGPV
jgi:predicted ABC-type transport system involved in lysophospholipase L1 biosynthesis ATPase subunit